MTARPMVFKNFGGLYQMQVLDDSDLSRIETLDAARWAATSAPTRDLHCDAGFLAYMDPAKTGRIRVSQLIAARDWMYERLANRARLREKSDTLHLADLDTSGEAGQRLRHAAEHVLGALDVQDRQTIALGQVRAFRAGYAQSLANGDGIVPPEVVPDPAVAELICDILATVGSSPDASGRPGTGEAELERFLEQGRAYQEWKTRPELDAEILPWGPETAENWALVEALDGKLEAYFWICDLLRQESGAAAQMQATPEELKALRSRDAAALEEYLAAAPLAAPVEDGHLPLDVLVNPVYQDRWGALRKQVLDSVLPQGTSALTRTSWRAVKERFAPYRAWLQQKPPEPFDKLDAAKLDAALSGELAERLRSFIAVDKAAAAELGQIGDLEKLVLYHRWLVELVNNFVNFSAIYHPSEIALIEMGTLVIDGRRLEFTNRVEDRAAHKKLAAESLICLLYAAITEQDGKVAFEVVAPVTAGDKGRLRIGKRGIFLDNAGREWDAQVVDMVENPISIGEAIRAPFRRAVAFVQKKIEDLAGSRLGAAEKLMTERLDKSVTGPAATPATKTAAAAAAGGAAGASAGGMQTLLLTGSVAFAAVGSALAYIVTAVSSISPLKALGAVAGIAGVVVVLSAILGWFKLRRRDMGLLLEANGWALNVHMSVTGRLGRMFTRTPALPKGSRKDRADVLLALLEEERDVAKRKARRRRRIVLLCVLVLALAALYLWLTRAGGWPVVKPWVEPLWRKAADLIQKPPEAPAP